MKKIPSVFMRDYEGNRQVYDEVVPGSEWVLAGEGVATEKYDGTSCMIRDGKLYKRYDCKKGRIPPENFEPCEPTRNEYTRHWPGWIPVGDGPEDKWHRHAEFKTVDGTYELIGAKVQGNPYDMDTHRLIKHGIIEIKNCPVTFESIRQYLENHKIEGIVWHHPDGRMAKLKRKDFGIKWPV